MELAYLKKLDALVQSPEKASAAEKTQVVQELRQLFPMAGLLKLAKLPRSTFYYQQQALHTADKYQQLKEKIRTRFDRHRGRYGYRRITAELRQSRKQVNHKLV